MKTKISVILTFDGCFDRHQSWIQFAKTLDEKKVEVQVLLVVRNEASYLPEFLKSVRQIEAVSDVREIYSGWLVDPMAVWKMHAAIKRFNSSLVHLWDRNSRHQFALLRAVSRLFGRKLVRWHYQDWPELEGEPSKLLGFLSFGQPVPIDDFFQPQSNQGTLLSTSIVIENFSKSEKSKSSETSSKLRRELGNSLGIPEDFQWVTVRANIDNPMVVKDAIWALDLVTCVMPKVCLIVLGECPRLEELRLFARQANVSDKVFFAGKTSQESNWISACDLLIAIHPIPNYCADLTHAFGVSTHVVASDVPTHKIAADSHPKGSGCQFFPSGDRAELARCLLDQFKSQVSDGAPETSLQESAT